MKPYAFVTIDMIIDGLDDADWAKDSQSKVNSLIHTVGQITRIQSLKVSILSTGEAGDKALPKRAL